VVEEPRHAERDNMHENRETSRAPAARAGRSGKAQSRTPDRNAREESDRTVVLLIPSNKAAARTAAAEKRGEKGATQGDSSVRQAGARLSTGLRLAHWLACGRWRQGASVSRL